MALYHETGICDSSELWLCITETGICDNSELPYVNASFRKDGDGRSRVGDDESRDRPICRGSSKEVHNTEVCMGSPSALCGLDLPLSVEERMRQRFAGEVISECL